jgi:Zn-dependent peptidase ImmA (M78 family)
MIGVTRVAVSQYERGVQTPSPDVMRSISSCLNLPIQFFQQPVSEVDEVLFFRSMASATKAARTRAARQFQWLQDIATFLGAYVRFPAVDLPRADVPKDPFRITDEMIEEAATALRRRWKLGDGPISDLTLLMENKGVVVSHLDMETDKLDAFSRWCSRSDRPNVILGTNRRTAVRSRANAAHELAHLVLHRHLSEADLRKPALFAEIERQAFRFGGAFLLPGDAFLNELYTVSLEAFYDIKPRWKVAIALMLKRAEDLGAVGEENARRLWIKLARNGWRKREPLDDSIPVEQPRFIRRCFEMLVENGVVRRHEIPLLLKLPATDIERLAELPDGYLTQSESEMPIVEPTIIKFPDQQAQ